MNIKIKRVPDDILMLQSKTYDYIKDFLYDLVKNSASSQLYNLDQEGLKNHLLSYVVGSRCLTLAEMTINEEKLFKNRALSVVINAHAREINVLKPSENQANQNHQFEWLKIKFKESPRTLKTWTT